MLLTTHNIFESYISLLSCIRKLFSRAWSLKPAYESIAVMKVNKYPTTYI